MENKTVSVKNRGIAGVVYNLPDSGVRRSFVAGEVKKDIPFKELEELTFIPGGKALLNKYLVINDKEVCEKLGLSVEPEYYYDDAEIKEILLNGSMEQFLDCLDFAPQGVLDLVKKYAVELRLNNVQKREAILKQLHFNVTTAISNIEYSKENVEEEASATRRTTPVKIDAEKPSEAPVRRQVPTYNRTQ